MRFEEYFEIVEDVKHRHAEERELRRAIGPWDWRVHSIRASGGRDLSERMAMLLALIVFDGYELFPGGKKK